MDVFPLALIVLWCTVICICDLRTRTIPPWLTWPVILGSGAWMAWGGFSAPLALFAWFFVWDTTWDDVHSLLGRDSRGEESVWLLPDPVGWAGTAAGVIWAGFQGEPALATAWFWALLHGLWRITGRAGGDIAFAMAIFGLFPTLRLWYVPILVSLGLLLVEVFRRRKEMAGVGYALALGRLLDAWQIWRSQVATSTPRPQALPLAAMAILMALLGGHYGVWNL